MTDQMPNPCTNCIVFHYGQCKYPPRQCRICWGWGHIERYCPSNPRGHSIRREHGEPLAGTRAWCERYGLNSDPDLKFQVLQALKTNPGSAIHINGVCIYGGSSKSYATANDARLTEPPRGRTLEQLMGDRDPRSLSPRDRRHLSRSLSPVSERRGRSSSPKAPGYGSMYRSRSPLRQRPRNPSPNRQPRTPSPGRQTGYRDRSPRYADDSNAVVFEARDQKPENRRPEGKAQNTGQFGRLSPVRFNIPRPHHALPPMHLGHPWVRSRLISREAIKQCSTQLRNKLTRLDPNLSSMIRTSYWESLKVLAMPSKQECTNSSPVLTLRLTGFSPLTRNKCMRSI
jgi:hypothetical protein